MPFPLFFGFLDPLFPSATPRPPSLNNITITHCQRQFPRTTTTNYTTGFQTDTAISNVSELRERKLVAWESDDIQSPDLSLGTSNSSAKWDQFAVNARLFGVETDYREEMYTTRLDTSSPGFKQRELEAERLAREIENSVSGSSHVMEERSSFVHNESLMDEEDRYSSVLRPSRSNSNSLSHSNPQSNSTANQTQDKYVPPAQRKASTSQQPPKSFSSVAGSAPYSTPVSASTSISNSTSSETRSFKDVVASEEKAARTTPIPVATSIKTTNVSAKSNPLSRIITVRVCSL